jgi:hypothetical protein
VAITYTFSQQFLGLGAGNQILQASPYDLGDNGELFLNQVQQNLCRNGALDATANTSYSTWNQDWQDMTTAKNGALDVPAADMGVHYFP